MKNTGKVATWLEVAAAAFLPGKHLKLQVHPLQEPCAVAQQSTQQDTQQAAQQPTQQPKNQMQMYAISVDGRWLHFNDGRLTVLKGLKTVDRFMDLIRRPAYEHGEPAQVDLASGRSAYCMVAGPNKALRGCK